MLSSCLARLTFGTALSASVCGAASSLPDTPLRNFQIQQYLAVPETKPCPVQLVRHLFANSYGQPATARYQPPLACGPPGAWDAVIMNLTVTSNGTQYDRLASLYLNRTEIWRTSTPEPTPKGIIWTALKDITHCNALLAKPGNLVFDLGNLLDPSSGLNGEYDVTLTASFYPRAKAHRPGSPDPADVILPIAQNVTDQGANFHIPPAASANLTLPRNGRRAFVEIYASGSGDEEFWYGNLPDEFFPQIPPWTGIDGYAVGKGPFREVQLLIDNHLAGVAFPYPVIYTGEFLPSLWRPMAAYGALDSPTYYVDITPFLPLLSDGAPHTFSLNVIGMGANRSINSDWILSGNIQIWLDASTRPTTGRITRYEAPSFVDPVVNGLVTGQAPQTNVSVTTMVKRQLHVAAEITTGSGVRAYVDWAQDLQYKNTEVYTITPRNISTQTVTQSSRGTSKSTHNLRPAIVDVLDYPLNLHITYNETVTNGTAFYDYNVALEQSYDRSLSVPSIRGNSIRTTQKSVGSQYKHIDAPTVRIRTGRTTQDFSYVDTASNSFSRSVGTETLQNTTTGLTTVVTASLLYDRKSGSLAHGHGGLSDVDQK